MIAMSTHADAPSSVVTIHGYEEHFAFSPSVKIFRNGAQVGEVGHHQNLKLEVEADCVLEFRASFRSARASIRKGIDTHILLSFDRFTGSLRAAVANDANLAEARKLKAGNATNAILRAVMLIGALAVLWFVLQPR
jgi:hypothetical protein